MAEWTLESIFVCAVKISARLRALNPRFPRELQTILGDVEEHLRLTRGMTVSIHTHPRLYEAKAFIGTMLDLGSTVHIFYDRNQNQCWRRFILAKELCQVLYDLPADRHLTSTPEQISGLLTQLLAGLGAMDFKDHASGSEQVSILMAIEILLPHSERANVGKMLAKAATTRRIAEHYLLPEQMVSLYLNGQYADLLERATKVFQRPI